MQDFCNIKKTIKNGRQSLIFCFIAVKFVKDDPCTIPYI